MSQNNPYAKLGGGALDQELFKNKQILPPASDNSENNRKPKSPPSPPPSRKASEKKETKSIMTDVMTSSLHDVNLRVWRDTIENTETHNSSLRLTTEEGQDIEDLLSFA
jgi:hypothetical protein